MKNIILIFLTVTTLLSCSNDKNQEDYTAPPELLGTWQFKGIYAHDVYDENNMPLYTPYDNGDLITYYENNTFIHILENVEYTGTFSVINGTNLTINYNPNPNGIVGGRSKLILLTENIVKLSCFNEGLCDVSRYEKVASD